MLELPYVAGIIDGEGCIRVTQHKRGKTLCLYVTVEMTNNELIELLCAQFGGEIYTTMRKSPHKPVFRFYLSQAKAAAFIEKVEPWLIVKKNQARLALAWHRSRAKVDYNDDLQKSILAAMHMYNKRGL